MFSFFMCRPRITGFTLGKSYDCIRATDASLFGLNTGDICCGVAYGLAFFEVLDIDMIVDRLKTATVESYLTINLSGVETRTFDDAKKQGIISIGIDYVETNKPLSSYTYDFIFLSHLSVKNYYNI